jgi:3-deoxy-7-phosphoheptulonate synthase
VHGVSLGAVAAGAHGLIVEVHERPEAALVDGSQSLDIRGAERLLDAVEKVAAATGRRLDRGRRTVAA